MIWLSCLCAVLLISTAVLSVKLILMKKAANEIRQEFAEKLENDTNTLILISSRDKDMCRLANDINWQLRELRKEKRRCLQGDLELKNAVTNISHDLRTPLTAICGYLDLLDQTKKSEPAERYIEIIKNRTECLKQLTEELFRYSVIASPDNDTSITPVSINRVLEEGIAAFYAVLRQQNIKPEIHLPETPVVRHLNQASLARIFSNLISNAIKYSDGDLAITLSESGEITFANTAESLTEVQVGKLFDRFYTVEDARKSTGLGLSISKILVEQMNGEIIARYFGNKLSITIRFED